MSSNKRKKKHQDIPIDWKVIGEGGNAYVWQDGNYAVKRLKSEVGDESKRRFIKEAEFCSNLIDSEKLAVVPIIEIRDRAGSAEIVMKKLTGNLSKIIGRFKGDAVTAAKALIPIVQALEYLSTNYGVHHRDIKPQNILYEDIEGEARLFLGDFGCAYIPQSIRMTPGDARAMGAWQYRPPEYCSGFVDRIDEKGDVFGIGKVFWEMIYGRQGVTFPGSLWFMDDFDLSRVYPSDRNVAYAMLIIAKTSNIHPTSRPTLKQLDGMLSVFADNAIDQEIGDGMDLLKAESLQKMLHEQRKNENKNFVELLFGDLMWSVDDLAIQHPESELFLEWKVKFNQSPRSTTLSEIIDRVCEMELDCWMPHATKFRVELSAIFRQSDGGGLSFRIYVKSNASNKSFELWIGNDVSGLFVEEKSANETKCAYEKGIIKNFLFSSVLAVMT